MSLIDPAEIGQKGGLKRAENMTAAERTQSARAAARARWDHYRLTHPEKPKEKVVRKRRRRRAA